MIAGWRRRRGVAPGRPSRRRTAVAVAVVLVVAVVIGEVVADVVTANAKAGRAESRSYVAAMLPVVDESNALAPVLHHVRSQAVSLTRTELEAELGRLVTGTSDVESVVSSIDLAPPSQHSAALFSAALADRSAGARSLTGGLELAIGPSSATAGNGSAPGTGTADNAVQARATSLVVTAGRDFEASDAAYRGFVASLPATSLPGRLPPSNWLTVPAAWAPGAAGIWVAQLASTTALTAHESLVIVALTVQPPAVRITGIAPPTTTTTTTSTTTSTTTTTTLPGAPTSSTTSSTTSTTTTSTSTTTTTLQLPPAGSDSVLAPTRVISVELVVANAGDVTETDVWASGSLQPIAGSFPAGTHEPPIRSVARRIGTLAPGASVALTLPGLVAVPGGGYTLSVSIGVGPLPTGPVTATNGAGQTDTVQLTVAAA